MSRRPGREHTEPESGQRIVFLPRSSTPLSQLEALGLALLGYTLWVLSDACLKFAGSSSLPSYEVTGLLGLSIAIILLTDGLWSRNLALLWPRSPTRLLLRSLLDVINGFGVVVALRHMPLALFYILIFCSPILSTLLAAIFLGEPLQAKRVLSVLVGFAGAVVAINPFRLHQAAETRGYLACLVCVLAISANMVWSRKMTQTESPESLTLFSGALIAAVSLPAVLNRSVHVSLHVAGVIAVAGLFNLFGSLCFLRALRRCSAAAVSQCHYSQVVTGALIGLLVWHEKLSVSMLFGAALIIAAGGYTATLPSAVQGKESLG